MRSYKIATTRESAHARTSITVKNRWCWPIIIWQSLLLLILSYSGGFPADVIYIHNKSAGTNLEIAFRVIALRYSTAEFLHNGSHILMPYAVSIIIV